MFKTMNYLSTKNITNEITIIN